MLNRMIVAAMAFMAVCSSAQLVFAQRSNARSIDGTGNNRANPLWGATETPLARIAPADYPDDGSGFTMYVEPDLPNPRDVSNVIAVQSEPTVNDRGLSDFIWAWGQFVDHDIDLTVTHPDFGTADIPILDASDPLGPNPIPFTRSVYDSSSGTPDVPRQQLNLITSFIDASNVYGSDEVTAAELRTFEDGRLNTSSGNLLPLDADGLFFAGDVRANEQVALTALHTLFVREHNRLAGRIAARSRRASDEQIYQLARKIVGAEVQIITYQEFLPALLGPSARSLGDYSGWKSNVNPSIATEFSTAFYRFGHSLLSPDLQLADDAGPIGLLPLRGAFFNPGFLSGDPLNVDYLLKGLSVQYSQEVDNKLVEDVRSFLFGPPGAGGLDLASLNIQRGRDHGLPSYNVLRAAYGLFPVASFDEISSDVSVQASLELLYGNVDAMDAWVGGLAEDHLPGASVGPLVAAALVDQFTRLKDGDRFFYRNDRELRQSNVREVIDLDRTTLARIIRDNTTIQSLPQNVFFVSTPSRPSNRDDRRDDRRGDRRGRGRRR